MTFQKAEKLHSMKLSDCGGDEYAIYYDKYYLCPVIQNLLFNACKGNATYLGCN